MWNLPVILGWGCQLPALAKLIAAAFNWHFADAGIDAAANVCAAIGMGVGSTVLTMAEPGLKEPTYSPVKR